MTLDGFLQVHAGCLMLMNFKLKQPRGAICKEEKKNCEKVEGGEGQILIECLRPPTVER